MGENASYRASGVEHLSPVVHAVEPLTYSVLQDDDFFPSSNEYCIFFLSLSLSRLVTTPNVGRHERTPPLADMATDGASGSPTPRDGAYDGQR